MFKTLADNPDKPAKVTIKRGDRQMKALGMTNGFKWVAAGLVAVTAFGLAGCGKKDDQSGAGGKASTIQRVVKIGHAAPLTGGIAHLGKDNENGVRLALDQANAKGMTIGGKKVKFELMAEDDQA